MQKYGGISRYFVELVKRLNLKEKTHIRNIKINSFFYKNNYLANLKNNILFNGFKISDFKGSSKLCLIFNAIFSIILTKLYDPDLIHETYYSNIKSYSSRAKKIITVYDMIHEIFPDQFKKNDKTTELKKKSVKRADHIICISKNTQKDLIKFFNVDIKKTSVIHLGFSLTTKDVEQPKELYRPYLLYVGSRNGYKNFTRLLEAYASPKIKNSYDLVIFGGGKLNKNEILALENLKISKESIRHYDGNDSVLGGFYKNASLFVYPSLYEGFGLTPLEAMNYGCAVACSNTSSIPEVVGKAAVFFDPYSIHSIRNNIISILENTKLQSLIIEEGFKQIKKFSWENCARQTYDVYKKVLR